MQEHRTSGFGSPAENHLERPIKLDDLVGYNHQNTFLYRAKGNGLHGAGVQDGSFMVVDRALKPWPGCIVLVHIHGTIEFRYFQKSGTAIYLNTDNSQYRMTEGDEIQGVVRACVTKFAGDGKAHRTGRLQ